MLYVMYHVAPQQRSGFRRFESNGNTRKDSSLFPELNSDDPLQNFEYRAIQDFLSKHPSAEKIGEFSETPESRRTAKWPQLQKALEICQQKTATLLIAELGNLSSNESFSHILLGSGVPFHCLDQPFVNQTILEALSKHAEIQRKLHGKLIREGLKMTTAKSGNPNAAEVISKVNKPKIDTAIVFACLLLPIIQDYRRRGFSQRQMVKTLNEEGFTAPEGGKWVLSQLQKVLDRVRLNEIATELKPKFEAYNKEGLTSLQIAEHLNTQNIPSLKQSTWDEAQVKKLQDRLQQLQDIVLINRFVLDLLPLLHDYHQKEFTPLNILMELEASGMPIRHSKKHNLMTPQPSLAEKQNQSLIEQLKQDLKAFPEAAQSLEQAFESAAKHIPAYRKIVQGHIEQLAKVLELETHNHRKLESVGLAEPVIQLIQLFQELKEDDIQLLEMLAIEAHEWSNETLEPLEEIVPSVAEA